MVEVVYPEFEMNIELEQKLDKYSKKYIFVISGHGCTCREEVAECIMDNIPYNYHAHPIYKGSDGETRPLKSSMIMHFGYSGDMDRICKHLDKFPDTLDYVVGIIGVCLSKGSDEKTRRDLLSSARANTTVIEDEYHAEDYINIKYNALSSFIISSPPMFSFISGLMRTTLSFAIDPTLRFKSRVLDKIDKKEIYRIINENDYTAAIKVYETILKPYFEFIRKNHNWGDFILYNKSYQDTLFNWILQGDGFSRRYVGSNWEDTYQEWGFWAYSDGDPRGDDEDDDWYDDEDDDDYW